MDVVLLGEISDLIGDADANALAAKNNTATNNTASATGTLSQKLSWIGNSLIGATGNTGGTASAGTVMAKLNKIISDLSTHMGRWTSARAGYIDNIRSYTVTDNSGSKTGVLSQKSSYIISLLENSTYGLNKLRGYLEDSSVHYTGATSATLFDKTYNNGETIPAGTVFVELNDVMFKGPIKDGYSESGSIYIDGRYIGRENSEEKASILIVMDGYSQEYQFNYYGYSGNYYHIYPPLNIKIKNFKIIAKTDIKGSGSYSSYPSIAIRFSDQTKIYKL